MHIYNIYICIIYNIYNNIYCLDTSDFFKLKVQLCKIHDNKYMIASTQTLKFPQINNIAISAFKAILVFKLLSRKVLFINRTENRNY